MSELKFNIGSKAYPCDLSFLHKKGECGKKIDLQKFENSKYDWMRYKEVRVISKPYVKTVSLSGIPDEKFDFVDVEYDGDVYSIQESGLRGTKEDVNEWRITTSLFDYLYPMHEAFDW